MEVNDWLKDKIENADSDRTAWQFNCLKTWSERGYRASVEACTGSGKSRIGLHAIQLLRRNNKERKVIIVVPTLQLKGQWEDQLKSWKIDKFSEVMVINTAAKTRVECDLLIIDEAHRAAATTFAKLFESIKYNFVLGLTATMKRLDGKHLTLNKYCPICVKLSMAQARQKGWVADFREYWLGLELSEEDRIYYQSLEEQFRKFFKVFDMDFGLLKRALNNSPLRSHIASRHRLDPEFVQLAAINSMRYIRMMRKWIIEHESKIEAAVEIIQAMDRKTITFGESIAIANELSFRLGDTAMAFHSEMESIEKETFNDKEFKTEENARKHIVKALEKNPDEKVSYKFKHGKHVAQYRVVRKLSGKKLKEYVLHKIANTSQLMTITTAKALSEGFDFPGAQLGVTLSRSSSSTRYIQETGRVCRLNKDDNTRPIMVHIYLKDTKDQNWLNSAGYGALGAIRVNTVDELLEHLESRQYV
jgi:superfamily II DNA or RNA helicase